STETQTTLVNRASCYLDYYKSGGFAVANGKSRAEYKEHPFRVLFVLKNTERRNNTAERLLEAMPPIRTFVYLSTLEEVLKNPLGSTWLRPVDYRDAVGYVISSKHLRPPVYRRQSMREKLIEQTAKKLTLFDNE